MACIYIYIYSKFLIKSTTYLNLNVSSAIEGVQYKQFIVKNYYNQFNDINLRSKVVSTTMDHNNTYFKPQTRLINLFN